MSELEPTFVPPGELLADIRALIAEARRQTTVAVNMGPTLLYWRIGQRTNVRCWAASAPPTANRFRDGVTTIGGGLRTRLFREEPPPNGSVCRAVSGARDCRDN